MGNAAANARADVILMNSRQASEKAQDCIDGIERDMPTDWRMVALAEASAWASLAVAAAIRERFIEHGLE